MVSSLPGASALGGLLGGGATASVRRPLFRIAFAAGAGGSGGGPGGALGGAASAVAGAAAALGVDLAGGATDPWQEATAAITLEAGVAPFADRLVIDLADDARAPSVALGDVGSVSLGYQDGGPTAVFGGRIEAVRRGLGGGVRILAANGGAALARLRVNQSYQNRSAGDVVRDLAGRAAVETDAVEDGTTFPFVVVDDRRGAYAQIAALARRCGFLASFTGEGKLRFGPPADGQASQSFAYGVDVLALHAVETSPAVGEVTAVGEGAAGGSGQEAWSWLVKDPSAVTDRAGSGDPARLLTDGALRSRDAVRRAAAAVSDAAAATSLAGTLLVAGAPAVALGGAVEVTGAPEARLNGLWAVRRVRHRYAKREGFTTLLGLVKPGGPS
jgi:phage protein D